MNNKTLTKLKFIKKNFFLSPSGDNYYKLLDLAKIAIISLIKNQGNGPIYPGFKNAKNSNNFKDILKIRNPKKVIKELYKELGGAVKASNPLMVKNIIPLPSFVSLSSYLASSVLMANAVTGEDAGKMLDCEKKVSHFVSHLIGINPNQSAGFFTWGGTATNFYALKIGLSKVDPEHGKRGVKEQVIALESWPAHYSHRTAMNWLGLGEENLIRIKSNKNQTTNLDDLKEKLENCIRQNKKIACIFCCGGTTSNVAIDDIKKIAKIRNELVKKYKLNYTPHIHADTVSGWAYSVFRLYNLNENKFGVNKDILKHIKKIKRLVSNLKYADSFGMDFHKTGYVQYVSSLFLVKNSSELIFLLKDKKYTSPLFHDDKAYNPGLFFTMETSRASSNIVSTWMHLKSLGAEGLQILLTKNLENAFFIRELFNSKKAKEEGLLLINPDFFGSDIFLRCFLSKNPYLDHKKELLKKEEIEKNNILLKEFFDFIRDKKRYNQKFSVSYSSAAFYNRGGMPITGIRIYLLNPYINKDTLKRLYTYILKAYMDFKNEKRI